MKRIVYPLCALGGAGIAAGLAFVVGGPSAASRTGPAAVLSGVQGAPGDGNVALAEAIGTMLANADIPVVDSFGPCTVAVSAEVSVLPFQDGEQVSIVWQVHDAEGAPLGEVAQINAVAAGALDRAWGTEASLAARGARDGIAAIMRRPRAGCS